MDNPIHIDTVKMELIILYLKGFQVKISIKWCIFGSRRLFYFGKQCRPLCAGSSLYAELPVYQYPEWKGLKAPIICVTSVCSLENWTAINPNFRISR